MERITNGESQYDNSTENGNSEPKVEYYDDVYGPGMYEPNITAVRTTPRGAGTMGPAALRLMHI